MKFKIFLEYSGHNYSGWQKQPSQSDVKTVQGTLIKAIQTVFKKNKGDSKFTDLQGAGRTDAGVHAIEQVAHLDCETMLGPEILKMKINDELPSDINILEIEKGHEAFHARHDAIARQYLYVISKRRTAFEKRYVWWIKDSLDVKKMKEVSKLFVGMHDFRNFAEKSPEDKSTKCKIEKLDISEDDKKIYVRIKASHFLWKMVRRIVGTLVEVGRGNVAKRDIELLLAPLSSRRGEGPRLVESKTHRGGEEFDPAQYTAPPSGLFLEKVFY